MIRYIILILLLLLPSNPVLGARAKLSPISKDPFVSAVAIDANSGKMLVNENGGATIYPASVLKMMDLLIILEEIEQNQLQLNEMVQVTKEASQMGGSQVYLDPKEQFSVEDLLYALMVQSANDAAVALATHVAGSKAGFVAMMNQKASALGMTNTRFHSVHGLPPSQGQEVDRTTAEDLAILGRALAQKPEAFKYTSTRVRDFRDGKFVMRTHNHLLEDVYGCDGFKTGYFQAGGFSIVATAQRRGVRIITVIAGSKNRKVRDSKARELMEKGFAMIPPQPKSVVSAKNATPLATTAVEPTGGKKPPEETQSVPLPVQILAKTGSAGIPWRVFFTGVVAGVLLYGVFHYLLSRKKRRRYTRYSR